METNAAEESIVKSKQPDLPPFYYEIDDDKLYTAEDVHDLCKSTHNNAVDACMKTIFSHFGTQNMKNFANRMTYLLGKNLI